MLAIFLPKTMNIIFYLVLIDIFRYIKISFLVVLKSTDSFEYFDKQPTCFRVHSNKQIQLDGNWTVALTEFATESWHLATNFRDIYLLWNLDGNHCRWQGLTPIRTSFLRENRETTILPNLDRFPECVRYSHKNSGIWVGSWIHGFKEKSIIYERQCIQSWWNRAGDSWEDCNRQFTFAKYVFLDVYLTDKLVSFNTNNSPHGKPI